VVTWREARRRFRRDFVTAPTAARPSTSLLYLLGGALHDAIRSVKIAFWQIAAGKKPVILSLRSL